MRRRAFLGLVGGAAAAWPLGVKAQQIKSVPRVGVLWHAGSADEEEVYLTVLQKAFRDLGYVEGRNITLEHRFPAEQADRFRSMARPLAESKVDVRSAFALGQRRRRDRITQHVCIWHISDMVALANDVRCCGYSEVGLRGCEVSF